MSQLFALPEPVLDAHPVGVMCDWLSGVHRFHKPVQAWEAGKTMRISRDGEIEWESQSWDTIRCPSSDTSIRIKCDGSKLWFSGNIGRFQQEQNTTGLRVAECVEKWAEVLSDLGLPLVGFGNRMQADTVGEWGTFLRRIDLAGNFDVSDYAAWCRVLLMRPISRKHPQAGKYGPTWGYDAKRSNWWKAKVYDKAAEQAGERKPRSGRTTARMEVQLGSEWLKREGLDKCERWLGVRDMGQIIYGQFAADLFKDPPSVEDWTDIPPRLRQYAVLWRDGHSIEAMLSRAQFYRVKAGLKEYGIDISVPCNVTALALRSRVVEVQPLDAIDWTRYAA